MMMAEKDTDTPKLSRIVVAEDELLVAEGICRALQDLDYQVTAICPDGNQVVAHCRREPPDLALLDIRMPNMTGLEAARILFGELGIPVMIISAYSDPEYARTSANYGVFGYLLKPVTIDDLRVALPVAWGQYLTHRKAGDEVNALRKRLEERKIIEKAKWILVDRLGVDEESAMRRLQKQARDNRRTLADVAKSILENHDLFLGEA